MKNKENFYNIKRYIFNMFVKLVIYKNQMLTNTNNYHFK